MPKKSIADKYYGAFQVEKWPEDLNELLAKLITENASKKLNESSKKQPLRCKR
jgi:hypothetical protein